MTTSLVTTQAALLARIKLIPTILADLGTKDEIRELEWNGTDYKFPNIRVRVNEFIRQVPIQSCSTHDVNASVYVFGDEASSLKINQIATKIYEALDAKSFTQSGIKFGSIIIKQFGAAWVSEEGLWRSELQMIFKVT